MSLMSQGWVFVFFIGLCHGVSSTTQCTARGRFPNDVMTDCRGYTTCLAGGENVFYQYDLACPPGYIYNHFDSGCANSTGYQCLSEYNCTVRGNFVSPNSKCKSYVSCIDGLSNLATARLIECPMNTVFSSVQGVCVNETNYMCPSAEPSTPTSPSSVPEVIIENIPMPFANDAVNIRCAWCMTLLALFYVFL